MIPNCFQGPSYSKHCFSERAFCPRVVASQIPWRDDFHLDTLEDLHPSDSSGLLQEGSCIPDTTEGQYGTGGRQDVDTLDTLEGRRALNTWRAIVPCEARDWDGAGRARCACVSLVSGQVGHERPIPSMIALQCPCPCLQNCIQNDVNLRPAVLPSMDPPHHQPTSMCSG